MSQDAEFAAFVISFDVLFGGDALTYVFLRLCL